MRENSPRISERLLARLWRKRAARQAWLRTETGQKVRVIYPGRAGTRAGPDFLDAVLEVEGLGVVRGDVEIHVRQGDWDHHGHGSDPNYNGVVLHAALEVEPSPDATELQSGRRVPVVSLAQLLDAPDLPDDGPNATLWWLLGGKGYQQPSTCAALGALLDRAGDDRFLARSAYFQKVLQEQGSDQTLYEGIMEGLGYRANQQPFLKLATRAPYAVIERAALRMGYEGGVSRAAAIESWLLKLAGFSYDTQGLTGLEGMPLPRAGFGAPMSAGDWHCFRLRPSNHPRRRIAGAASLLDRYLDQGLAAGLREAAREENPKTLTSALEAASGLGRAQASIGKDRARDLAVNVALPFLHASVSHAPVSRNGSRRRVGEEADYLVLYQRFGRLQDNELTREMSEQLIDPAWTGAIGTARRQQGLLHLHSVLAGAG